MEVGVMRVRVESRLLISRLSTASDPKSENDE